MTCVRSRCLIRLTTNAICHRARSHLEDFFRRPHLLERGHQHDHAEIEYFRFTDRPAFVTGFLELAPAFRGSDIGWQSKREEADWHALLAEWAISVD